jgi:hypothetical protein
MTAPQIEGIVGARHGAGELVVVAGDHRAVNSRKIAALAKRLPPGSRYSVLSWPHECHRQDITRDLRDGLFVFVAVTGDLSRFPVKPYKLFHAIASRQAA